MENLCDHIENNLENDISLENLSKTAFMSKYHLLRLFKSITNMGLMEYITKRRLTESLKDLLNTDKGIAFIANQYSFSIESYSRAFKKMTGKSPSNYRKKPVSVRVCEKFNLSNIIELNNGVLFIPEIKMIPEFYVCGYKYMYNQYYDVRDSLNIKRASQFLYSEQGINSIYPTIYLGLTEVKKEEFPVSWYYTTQIVGKNYIPCAGQVKIKIETNQYAVFKYVGSHNLLDLCGEDLIQICNTIFEIWFPAHNIDPKEFYLYEYVDIHQIFQDVSCFYIYCPLTIQGLYVCKDNC